MLRILGNRKRLCDGISRRDLLHVGGAGLLGLTLPRLLAAQSQAAEAQPAVRGDLAASFGRAKHCILLFLYGSPSQLETFDMKPNAPVEIRGTMKAIPSSLRGLDVVEHLPRTARVMDRVTVVRSVTHPYPIHGVAFATTGTPAIDVAMELSPERSAAPAVLRIDRRILARAAQAGTVPTPSITSFCRSHSAVSGLTNRTGPGLTLPIWEANTVPSGASS